MRSSLVILSFSAAVIGCGGGGGNNNHIDMSMKVNSADMTLAPANCDLVKQDCGASKKCVITIDQTSGAVSGTCVTDGNGAAGAACTQDQSDASLVNDDCKAGLVCDGIYGAIGTTNCYKICNVDSDCASTQKCLDFFNGGHGSSIGWCVTTCTPFSNDCATATVGSQPQDCGENWFDITQADPTTPVTGYFYCKNTGSVEAYAPCTGDPDCKANSFCLQTSSGGDAICIPDCDTTHMCGSIPADAGVGGFTGVSCDAPYTNLTNMAGGCDPSTM